MAEGQERLLYMLLAGSGLRVGEAVALQAEDFEGIVVRVRHSLWNGKLHSPKTKNGTREVDLHSSLAEAMAEHLWTRKAGYVFRNAAGSGLHQTCCGDRCIRSFASWNWRDAAFTRFAGSA